MLRSKKYLPPLNELVQKREVLLCCTVCVRVCVCVCDTHKERADRDHMLVLSECLNSVRPTDIHKKYINDRLLDERVNRNKSNKTIKQDTKKHGHTSDERVR
jgi:hypothetical protein